MVTTEATAQSADGITLVTVRLAGDGAARRVRVDNRLDGPVWPPRREGRPVSGWDESGYEGVVPAEGHLSLGYATPAPAEETPVTVETIATVRDGASASAPDTPADVIRRLGDPAPPREAVPVPEIGRPQTDGSEGPNGDGSPLTATEDSLTAATGPGPDQRSEPAPRPEPERSGEPDDAPTEERPVDRDSIARSDDPVAAWLDRVERRVSTVERLDDADSVPTVANALMDAGGLDASRRAVRATAADRRRLLAVARRARGLADRIETTDPDLATLERVR